MTRLPFPWLLLLVLLPAGGALATRLLGRHRHGRTMAVCVAGLTLTLALWVTLAALPPGRAPLRVDPWTFGILGAPHPTLGVDGLSGPAAVLVAVIALMATVALPWEQRGARLARILATEAALLGLLLSVDLALTALLWAASLLPTLTQVRETRARRALFAYHGLGALLLALAVALIGWGQAAAGNPTPLFLADLEAAPAALGLALPALLGAVAIRKGLLPAHSWVPLLFEAGPAEGATLLVAPQVGTYVLLRLLTGPLAGASPQALEALGALAIASAVVAALLALVQHDLRRTLGLLAVSQSALVLAGIPSRTEAGMTGSLLTWLSVGLSLAGLALVVEAIEARFGRQDLRRERGLAARAPRLGALFLLLGLASVGVPGSLGFASEDLLFQGVLEGYPHLGVGIVLAAALAGFVVLRTYFRLFHGPAAALPPVRDALPREAAVLVGTVLALGALGLLAGPVTRAGAPLGARLVERLGGPEGDAPGTQPRRAP